MRKEKGSALGDEKQGNAQIYAHIHTITLVRAEHRDLHLLVFEVLSYLLRNFGRKLINHHNIELNGRQ